jgi:hypothetical protein
MILVPSGPEIGWPAREIVASGMWTGKSVPEGLRDITPPVLPLPDSSDKGGLERSLPCYPMGLGMTATTYASAPLGSFSLDAWIENAGSCCPDRLNSRSAPQRHRRKAWGFNPREPAGSTPGQLPHPSSKPAGAAVNRLMRWFSPRISLLTSPRTASPVLASVPSPLRGLDEWEAVDLGLKPQALCLGPWGRFAG